MFVPIRQKALHVGSGRCNINVITTSFTFIHFNVLLYFLNWTKVKSAKCDDAFLFDRQTKHTKKKKKHRLLLRFDPMVLFLEDSMQSIFKLYSKLKIQTPTRFQSKLLNTWPQWKLPPRVGWCAHLKCQILCGNIFILVRQLSTLDHVAKRFWSKLVDTGLCCFFFPNCNQAQ